MAEGRSLTGIAIGFLLMALVLMGAFVWAEATNNYMTVKPFVASLVTGPNQLKIQAVNLAQGYNVATSRWNNITIAVLNAGTTNSTGAIVYAELFNVNGTRIASGVRGLEPIPPNQTLFVNIALNWTQTTTIADYAFGKVTAT